jgi:hypothetical protein
MKTRSNKTMPTAYSRYPRIVDRRDDRREDAARDEPVDLLHVHVRERSASDARGRVEVDDPDDAERGGDEE